MDTGVAYSGQIGPWRALLLHGRILLHEALATPLLLPPFAATLLIGMAVSLRTGWLQPYPIAAGLGRVACP